MCKIMENMLMCLKTISCYSRISKHQILNSALVETFSWSSPWHVPAMRTNSVQLTVALILSLCLSKWVIFQQVVYLLRSLQPIFSFLAASHLTPKEFSQGCFMCLGHACTYLLQPIILLTIQQVWQAKSGVVSLQCTCTSTCVIYFKVSANFFFSLCHYLKCW